MRVLIIDDDKSSRMMLEMLAQHWGYETVTACDGGEGWELIQKGNHPDLMLIDWEMPVMNGPELCAKIRSCESAKNVYLILVTGRNSSDDIAHGLQQGANDYICKPFDQVELEARLAVGKRFIEIQTAYRETQEEKIRELEEEQTLAKTIYEEIVEIGTLDNYPINYHINPYGIFSGDMIFSQTDQAGRLHIVLADVTGHGLGAAICLIPVAISFYDSLKVSQDESQALTAMNSAMRKFSSLGKFCAIFYLVIDFKETCFKYWNAGIPYPKHFVAGTSQLDVLPSRNLPIGAIREREFKAEFIERSFERGDRIIFFTDGLLEATNDADEMFGNQRLSETLLKHIASDRLFEPLIAELKAFSGDEFQDDDITYVDIKL